MVEMPLPYWLGFVLVAVVAGCFNGVVVVPALSRRETASIKSRA